MSFIPGEKGRGSESRPDVETATSRDLGTSWGHGQRNLLTDGAGGVRINKSLFASRRNNLMDFDAVREVGREREDVKEEI